MNRPAPRFKASCISRNDLCASTEEAAKISGIPYTMDAYRAQATAIHCQTGPSKSWHTPGRLASRRNQVFTEKGTAAALPDDRVCWYASMMSV
jgi:CO/xanthine dehydrogenase Mo-binding subunit